MRNMSYIAGKIYAAAFPLATRQDVVQASLGCDDPEQFLAGFYNT